MDSYSKTARERAMKIQEVLLRAMARKITWLQAAEILGFTDRHVRRIRERYQSLAMMGCWIAAWANPHPNAHVVYCGVATFLASALFPSFVTTLAAVDLPASSSASASAP
jgi:hypothetical protein